MESAVDLYRQERASFLQNLVASLSTDERFVAGWLTGSLARNDADFLSDIDLNLAVSEEYSPSLCSRLEPISDQTSPERLSLFRQFGSPVLIHENNHNAPEGGTFTFVLYAESAIMVDWVLVPRSKAKRFSKSKLLFDQVGIPVFYTAVEDVEQSKKNVAERWAFFWMMAAITIKYILRDDGVFAAQWIEYLHALIHDVERQINRQPWIYQRGSFSQLQITRKEQIESLQQLCERMEDLRPSVSEFVGSDLPLPAAEIKRLLAFVSK
jgi:hypothetical protein